MSFSIRARGYLHSSVLLPIALWTCLGYVEAALAHDLLTESCPSLSLSASVQGFTTGSSLLQASSHTTSSSWRDVLDFPSSSNLLDKVSAHNDARSRTRVGLLVVGFIVLVLVGIRLYRAQYCSKPKRPDSPEASDVRERAKSEYGDLEDEESDTGEWQVDDLVNGTLTRFGMGVKPEESKASPRDDDKEAVTKHIYEKYGSWSLLKHILGALVEFWAALAFMYWSLLYREEEMMNCSSYPIDRPYGSVIRHACYYTTACLRGFPILAANMVLVLMIRIIVQTRMYYSMLRLGYVLHFVSAPIVHTLWPWFCGLSMLQGGLHFALKAMFDPEKEGSDSEIMYVRLVRKFVLPGTIFLSFLLRYADIENTLVPLNRICEKDCQKSTRECPWLSKIRVLNERVLAFDARHRDVVGASKIQAGKEPTLDDIVVNLIDNYEKAHKRWALRIHRDWGLFRSMWPASVLLDRRLDRKDPDTRAWLTAFAILLAGCAVVSIFSLYLLFFRMMFTGALEAGTSFLNTEVLLGDAILVFHGMVIITFIFRSAHHMFYFAFNSEEGSLVQWEASTPVGASGYRAPLVNQRSDSGL